MSGTSVYIRIYEILFSVQYVKMYFFLRRFITKNVTKMPPFYKDAII